MGQFCAYEPASKCWPTPAAISRWRSTLTDTIVVQPDDANFLRDAVSMNELKSNFPAMIVHPGNEKDVVSIVKFASRYRIRLVAKCSGHDYNDRSTGRGIIQLNTQRMANVTYDPQTTHITVQSGANFSTIYGFLEPLQRAAVGGQSMTVCLAGYVMGGGHSNLTPLYGLGVDNVISMRVVLYNGTVITTSQKLHSDLFNAILGSGANTYGVVLSIVYKTYPASPYILKITGFWSTPLTYGTPSVLDLAYNLTWYNNKPNNLVAPYVTVATTSEGNKTYGITDISFVITAPPYDVAMDYIKPFYSQPSFFKQSYKVENYSSLLQYAISIYGDAGETGEIWQRKMISNVMLPLDQDVLDQTVRVIIEEQFTAPFKLLMIHGGVSLNGSVGSSSLGLRKTFGEQAFGNQWNPIPKDFENMKNISDIMGRLKAFVNSSYVNEYTTYYDQYNVLPDWRTRFYDNYTNLLRVKSIYDPCNLYVVEYGVGSDQPVATCGFGMGRGTAGHKRFA